MNYRVRKVAIPSSGQEKAVQQNEPAPLLHELHAGLLYKAVDIDLLHTVGALKWPGALPALMS